MGYLGNNGWKHISHKYVRHLQSNFLAKSELYLSKIINTKCSCNKLKILLKKVFLKQQRNTLCITYNSYLSTGPKWVEYLLIRLTCIL